MAELKKKSTTEALACVAAPTLLQAEPKIPGVSTAEDVAAKKAEPEAAKKAEPEAAKNADLEDAKAKKAEPEPEPGEPAQQKLDGSKAEEGKVAKK